MQDFLAVVEDALRRSGMSPRRASLKAGCGASAIRDIRRGRAPSAERLAAICEVLGLELHIRPQPSKHDVVLSEPQFQRLRVVLRDLAALLEEIDGYNRPPPNAAAD